MKNKNEKRLNFPDNWLNDDSDVTDRRKENSRERAGNEWKKSGRKWKKTRNQAKGMLEVNELWLKDNEWKAAWREDDSWPTHQRALS